MIPQRPSRDELAEELARVYPPMAAQLADLLARLTASDSAIERVNAALPNGGRHLALAELSARELSGFRPDGLHTVPSITKDVRLPAFKFDKFDPFTWPRPKLNQGPT
jgi:hypothetical protein